MRIDHHGSVTATVPPTAAPGGPVPAAGKGRQRPRLYRATDGRVLGGVAKGLAIHLGVEVWVIRVAFVLLALNGGAGVAAYAAFWALVPLAPVAIGPLSIN